VRFNRAERLSELASGGVTNRGRTPLPIVEGRDSKCSRQIYTCDVDYQPRLCGTFRVIPDGRMEQIILNGIAVPLDGIPRTDLANGGTGFILRLGKLFRKGRNTVVFRLADDQRFTGLGVQSTAESYANPYLIPFYTLMTLSALGFLLFALRKSEMTLAFIREHRTAFLGGGIALAALLLRLFVVPIMSGDYRLFLSPWFETIRARGFSAFHDGFYNYSPLYVYLLGIATLLPTCKILSIKLVSVVFDFACALILSRAVSTLRPESKIASFAVFAATIFLPTVFVNSSLWGQCDVLYVTFVVASLLCLASGRKNSDFAALLCLGIAFSLKMQSLFVLPVFGIALISGKARWRAVLIPPAVYFLTLVPAALAGRPVSELVTTYLRQVDYFPKMTLNAPTVWQWLPDDARLLVPGLVFAAVTITLLIGAWIIRTRNAKPSAETLWRLALLFSLAMPFVLPRMHERYFFTAEMLSLVYGALYPRRVWVPVLTVTCSLLGYGSNLMNPAPVPMGFVSAGILALTVFVAVDLFRKPERRDAKISANANGRS
jgi:Gpi18-like mannosyltransferase